MFGCRVERFRRTIPIRPEATTTQLPCVEYGAICDEAGLFRPSSQDLRVRNLFCETRKLPALHKRANAGIPWLSTMIPNASRPLRWRTAVKCAPCTTCGFGNCEFQSLLEGNSLGAAGQTFQRRPVRGFLKLPSCLGPTLFAFVEIRALVREEPDRIGLFLFAGGLSKGLRAASNLRAC